MYKNICIHLCTYTLHILYILFLFRFFYFLFSSLSAQTQESLSEAAGEMYLTPIVLFFTLR